MSREPTRRFDPSESRRPRRLEETSTAEIGFPIAWVIIGGLAAMIIIGLVGLGVVNVMRQGGAITPTPEAPLLGAAPGETPGQEGAAFSATPTTLADQAQATPTVTPVPPTPTATPEPQPAVAQIAIEGYVTVANTGGAGVRIRPGPRRSAEDEQLVIPEGTILLVLDGPRADENQEDYIWWNVRWVENGTEGWVVEDFIAPAQAP